MDPSRVPVVRYGELVERRAARQPEMPAIRFEGTTMTYGELGERISHFHAALLHWGVCPGDRVLCVSGNRPEILVALFATARCGAVFVPVDPESRACEIADLMRDTAPTVALAEMETRGVLKQAAHLAAQNECALPAVRLRLIDTPLYPVADTDPLPCPVGPDAPAQIVYTAGATGRPKGVVLTHGSLFWNQINTLFGLDVSSDDVTLVNTPMFHATGLNTLAIATLHKGGTVVIQRGADPEACLEAVRDHRITTMFAVPATLELLSRDESFGSADLSSLRWMLVGGAPLPSGTVTTWWRRGVPLLAGYGLSEAGPSVSFRTPAQVAADPDTAGPPALLTDLSVVGPDGVPLGPGETGELVVQGPHLAVGYWNRPHATARTFRNDGLHTGDGGLLDSGGAVVVTGRQNDVITTGREDIDPVETEYAIASRQGGVPGDTYLSGPTVSLPDGNPMNDKRFADQRRFVYDGLPYRIVFGFGTRAQLPQEMERLGCRRPLLLATPGMDDVVAEVRTHLWAHDCGVFDSAATHTPVDVTDKALEAIRDHRADCTVAVGGGSAVGLGKAIALRTGLPQIVLPTTYAGSEVTPVIGEAREGRKTTQRTLDVLPKTVIYDVELTLGLPASVSAASGVNAMAHAAEALWSPDRNPLTSAFAQQSLQSLWRALPKIVAAPDDMDARTDALYGSWLAGTCLATAGMALHHKVCHVLGGMFDLPHALTHAVVLPHVVAFNAPAAPEAVGHIADAIGVPPPDCATALVHFTEKLGLPVSLAELGMPEDGIGSVAEQILGSPYANPRPLDFESLRMLVADAWSGAVPRRW
ncbi:iron-containing alcohol dehydrogenase [Streptomyces justiciae]|uniref:iron-containing alcohol dehydrogenase n=1 Tax=Streptomyces justiciae TaxID=2780140 RepID=UPI0021196917|nr:iron-containing alcohol dehydrogenase [Streptomyces justiciae]MCW8378649.1 iron-containing alcohol dehydrogenase [Streptomyces justiciae]